MRSNCIWGYLCRVIFLNIIFIMFCLCGIRCVERVSIDNNDLEVLLK